MLHIFTFLWIFFFVNIVSLFSLFLNIVSLFSLFLRMQDSSQLNLSLTIWEFRATAAFVIIGLQRMFQM